MHTVKFQLKFENYQMFVKMFAFQVPPSHKDPGKSERGGCKHFWQNLQYLLKH